MSIAKEGKDSTKHTALVTRANTFTYERESITIKRKFRL